MNKAYSLICLIVLLVIGSMELSYAQSKTNALDRANNSNRRGHAHKRPNTGVNPTTQNNASPATHNAAPTSSPNSGSNAGYAPAYYNAPSNVSTNTVYKIELGIFKNANPSEFAEINDLGTVEFIRAVGNLSHVLLGSYATMQTAEGVLKAVLARGYDRSIIVSRPGDTSTTYVPAFAPSNTAPTTNTSTNEGLGVIGGVTYGPVGPNTTTIYDVAPAPNTLPGTATQTSPSVVYQPPTQIQVAPAPQPQMAPIPQSVQYIPQPQPAPVQYTPAPPASVPASTLYERPTAPMLMSNTAPLVADVNAKAYMNVIANNAGDKVTLNFTTSQTQLIYIGMYAPNGVLVAEVFNGTANANLEYKRLINTQFLFPGNYHFRLSSQTAGVLQEDLLLHKQ